MSSYRTYEEWKLLLALVSPYSAHRSYRTYEEWKPFISQKCLGLEHGSYRTYEEWKQVSVNENKCLHCVLTVPMRNGNSSEVKIKGGRTKFLPYL